MTQTLDGHCTQFTAAVEAFHILATRSVTFVEM